MFASYDIYFIPFTVISSHGVSYVLHIIFIFISRFSMCSMASVDGAKSFLQGSEEVYENHCEPCESDGIVKEGKHYCPECKEYLCNACREFHRKLKITKHHKIVSAHDLGEHGTFHHCKVYCVCSQRNLVEVYCEEHGQVICHSCKNIKHFNCKTTSLSDKSDYYIPITDTNFELSIFWPSDTESRISELRFSESISLSFKTRLTSVTCFCGDVT